MSLATTKYKELFEEMKGKHQNGLSEIEYKEKDFLGRMVDLEERFWMWKVEFEDRQRAGEELEPVRKLLNDHLDKELRKKPQ